jgi:hypothetical protein
MADIPNTPEIVTARLLSRDAGNQFFILSDGRERFLCGSRHFPDGLSENQLVSFIPKRPAPGRGRLREVAQVVFQNEEVSQ